MQVPSILDSLRANQTPSYEAPIEWTKWTDVWEDELELYDRLRALYANSKSPDDALHWAAYIEQREPIDWQYFLEFFLECPAQYRTTRQLEVSSRVKSLTPHMAAMQLLYRYSTKQPTFDQTLLVPGSMQDLEIELVSVIAQDVWNSPKQNVLTKPLIARIAEFFKKYPHALGTDELPQHGVGLLFSTMIMGIEDPKYAVNIGEEEKYYKAACHNANDADILKIIAAHQQNPGWKRRMKHEFGIQWFEPFLQPENPHHLSFGIYQSLDPGMNIKQLAHFIQQQSQPPAESYPLESISIS